MDPSGFLLFHRQPLISLISIDIGNDWHRTVLDRGLLVVGNVTFLTTFLLGLVSLSAMEEARLFKLLTMQVSSLVNYECIKGEGLQV